MFRKLEDVTDRGATPRWVKVSLAIAVLVAALIAILLLTGRGGPHSPSRHAAPAAVPHGERS